MTSHPIIDFIEAQLAKDQEAAEAAGERSRTWEVTGTWHLEGTEHDVVGDEEAFCHPYNRTHIALHDPARVLREVEAKRRVMARHRPNQDGSELTWNREACLGCGGHERWEHTEANVDDVNDCPELRDLAAVYSDHSDYREDWVA